jgi:hypothetical protein
MLFPRELSPAEQDKLKYQIAQWHQITEEIGIFVNKFTPLLKNAITMEDYRNQAITKLWFMLDSTFKSIVILNTTGHFGDSFSILRILYECHLHLWNLIKGNEEQAKKFLWISIIQNWRLINKTEKYKDIPELNSFIKDRSDEQKREYQEAIGILKCKPNKIPGNYTPLSNKKIASLIDEKEHNLEPSKSFMHINLYSRGSEHIHRSYLSISEGFVSFDYNGIKVLIPSPARGVETAWWSSIIVLDSMRWMAEEFTINTDIDFKRQRDRIVNLINIWEPGELK